jgi:hypothetical protein
MCGEVGNHSFQRGDAEAKVSRRSETLLQRWHQTETGKCVEAKHRQVMLRLIALRQQVHGQDENTPESQQLDRIARDGIQDLEGSLRV